MNYRHLYHAGNIADVFKHLLLIQLLEKLRQKETPFLVLDTHAGTGLYDFTRAEPLKTLEFKEGIAPFYKQLTLLATPPSWASTYLSILNQENQSTEIRFYPGSPYIIHALLRPQDRGICCELHPEDSASLKKWASLFAPQLHIHTQNGYQAMKALLPPREKRGLVFIDPPFEKKEEFHLIIQALKTTLPHFRQGMYAIWYPIKTSLPIGAFINHLYSLPLIHRMLRIEIIFYPKKESLQGCGMILINPPWQLEHSLNDLLECVLKYTHSETSAHFNWEWLKQENTP